MRKIVRNSPNMTNKAIVRGSFHDQILPADVRTTVKAVQKPADSTNPIQSIFQSLALIVPDPRFLEGKKNNRIGVKIAPSGALI